MNYGNVVSKHVVNGVAKVGPGAWTRLTVSGGNPLNKRQWIEIQPRGKNPSGLALGYSTKNVDGTFTAPTYTAQAAKIIPAAASIKGEPLGDTVMWWGRLVQKGGDPHGGVKVIVTEYA